jgi:hypothetical protein
MNFGEPCIAETILETTRTMLRKVSPIVLAFALASSCFSFSAARAANRTEAAVFNVTDFLMKRPESGLYTVVAYISDITICAPGRPCSLDNITLTDKPLLESSDEKLRVYIATGDALKLQAGHKYKLQIHAGHTPRLDSAEQVQ